MAFSLPGKAASLLALSAQLAGQAWVPPSNGLAPPPDFVSVNGSGDGFVLNGARFVVSGANQVGQPFAGRGGLRGATRTSLPDDAPRS